MRLSGGGGRGGDGDGCGGGCFAGGQQVVKARKLRGRLLSISRYHEAAEVTGRRCGCGCGCGRDELGGKECDLELKSRHTAARLI